MDDLGRALRIDPVSGDLVLKVLEGGGVDLDEVIDLDEVVQSLHLRFRTRRGEDPLYPTLGFPIDSVLGLFDEEHIASEFRRTCLQDGRILTVSDIEVELRREVRVATVRGLLTLKDGRQLTHEESFGN